MFINYRNHFSNLVVDTYQTKEYMAEKIEKVFGPIEGVDEKSFKILANAIQKNNLPGFDYLEYKESVRSLQDMDMKKDMAYKSAFSTGSTVGLTLEKLIKSANHYIDVLNDEKQKFKVELQHQVQSKILSKENEKEKLRKKIETLQRQIASLEQEMTMSEKKLENYDAEVEDAKEKIRTASVNFNGTIDKLVEQIESDIQDIQANLV